MDRVSRDAATRRASLTTLGGACASYLAAACGGEPVCLNAVPCCTQLNTCSMNAFLISLVSSTGA